LGGAGQRQHKGTDDLSTDTSGAQKLPDLRNLPRTTHNHTDASPEWELNTSRRTVAFRDWWQKGADGITTRRNRKSDRAQRLREVDHIADHPHIPANLIEALQRGINPDDPLSGTTSTTIPIDGIDVHVAISPNGTGIPEPDSQTVWDSLCETVRNITARPYCADIVIPLPQEIAAIGWTGADGQPINITPCRALRLRGFLGIALLPLVRMGDIVTMSATSSVAALALGSFTPVSVPAEPAPDLRPKTGISQRHHQAGSALLPGPKKAPAKARPKRLIMAGVATRTSLPRLASTPPATSTTLKPTSTLDARPAPRPRPTVVPQVPKPNLPAIRVPRTPAELETLMASLPSLWRGNPA
jgi:hypothetical protein